MGNHNPKLAVSNIILPDRQAVTEQQVNQLLSVLHTLQNYLLAPHREFQVPAPPELDGGAHSSACSTLMKTCARLDSIIEDNSRWALEGNDKVCESVIKTHETQQEFLREQIASTKLIQRPSFQLKPVIATLEGAYLAFWGDISQPGRAIIGRGVTPSEALLDFDRAFNRTPEEQIFLIAELDSPKAIKKKKTLPPDADHSS